MKNNEIRSTLHFLQWTTLTFILTLGILLVFDIVRVREPLLNAQTTIAEMKQQDLANPEISRTVRDLDFLYRSTYFQTKDKQRRGVLLLGIAFFILCGLFGTEMFLFAPKLKIPQSNAAIPEKERRQLLVFAACGIFVLISAMLVLHFTLVQHSKTASANATNAKNATPVTLPSEKIDLLAAMEEEKSQWPQFRGSLLPNSNSLPDKWDFSQKWSSTIELPGNNSPVIWNDLIFLSGGDGKNYAVFCYDANTGALKWKTVVPQNANSPDVSEDTGFAAPTLCVDSKRVYAVFATGTVLCLNHDGSQLWSRQMPDPVIMYGYASSPLLMGDKLIIQYDLDEKQTIFALNIFTGDIAWKNERESANSWSSPRGLVLDGKGVVFTAGNRFAEAFSLDDGKRLWSQECMGGEIATSATVRDGVIYFSNSSAFTGAFKANDGEILYNNEDAPAPDVASPVLCGNQFLLFGSGGTILAIDAKDGHELYEEDLDNGFYASPVVLGEYVVAVNLDGDIFKFAPGTDKIETLGKFSLGKKVVCVPAFHHGNLILRTSENELICLESKQ